MQRVRPARKLVRAGPTDHKKEDAALCRLADGPDSLRRLSTPPAVGGAGQRRALDGGGQTEIVAAASGGSSSGPDSRTVVERLRDSLDAMARRECLRPQELLPLQSAGMSPGRRNRQVTRPEATETFSLSADGLGSAAPVPSSWLQGSPCALESSRCVATLQLGLDTLQFPFPPMHPQVALAERAVHACETGGIALLQSPTGTGKSVALLCAALAWQRRCFAERGAAPQILYGVRTHAQLSQVVGELRKTPYRPRMAVIGSRDSMCINEDVKANARLQQMPLNLACRQAARRAVAGSKGVGRGSGSGGEQASGCACHAYTNLGTARHSRRVFENCARAGQLWDVEDLTTLSRTSAQDGGCPYYTSHIVAGSAEIVFCPHNYLLDPSVSQCRSHHRERWSLQGRIVIIDEAHNLEQCCRDSGSLEVTLQDLRLLTRALRALPLRHPRLRFHVGGSSSSSNRAGGSARTGDGSGNGDAQRHLSCAKAAEELERLPLALAALLEAKFGDLIPRSGGVDREGPTAKGTWGLPGHPATSDFLRLAGLAEHGLLSRRMEDLSLEVTDRLLQVQLSSEASAVGSAAAAAASDAEDAALLAVLDRLRELLFKLRLAARHSESYVIRCQAEGSAAQGAEASHGRGGISLSVWLMSPGVLFEVFAAQAHAVLLASGTLAPLGALGAELSASHALATRALPEGALEAPHVVQPGQVLATVLSNFLGSGLPAVGTFGSWSSQAFLEDLGDTLVTLLGCMPGGVLCFLPSYAAIDAAVAAWKRQEASSASIWSRLQGIKGALVVEPRVQGRGGLVEACKTFSNAARSPSGAFCLAVYRGKMSEGLDFADDLCRGVVCVGVPYPQAKDPVVIAKKQWNDARHAGAATSGLSGEQWYELQAYRAVNQALGRCIRHCHDYGALVLLDARWASRGSRARSLRRHVARWLQPYLEEWPPSHLAPVGVGRSGGGISGSGGSRSSASSGGSHPFVQRLQRHFREATAVAAARCSGGADNVTTGTASAAEAGTIVFQQSRLQQPQQQQQQQQQPPSILTAWSVIPAVTDTVPIAETAASETIVVVTSTMTRATVGSPRQACLTQLRANPQIAHSTSASAFLPVFGPAARAKPGFVPTPLNVALKPKLGWPASLFPIGVPSHVRRMCADDAYCLGNTRSRCVCLLRWCLHGVTAAAWLRACRTKREPHAV
ncbi:unnamed protein product [Polarella glacialis]|uniref:Helicase ATP-binding domain-containing protein n=1 Tax=Polarella glacialis TaxID=89957 RepID=A0A813DPK9_POLGL|nr:unnamed protein product [Polarella glacialis]